MWLFSDIIDENNLETILTQLKDADYVCLETMFGKPPLRRDLLDRLGLTCYATHVALAAMPERTELTEFAHAMGAETVCVSGLIQWDERSADDYRRAADALNVLGAQLREDGLSLHYHNHDFEFAVVNGTATGMDLLASHLDPAVAPFCFDAGWALLAGHDAAEFAAKYASRIGTLHLRDFRDKKSVRLGAGSLDLAPVIAQIDALPNLRAVLVEQDPGTETAVEDMTASRRFLRDRFGL